MKTLWLAGLAIMVLSAAPAIAKDDVRIESYDPPVEVLGLLSNQARFHDDILYRVDLAAEDTVSGFVVPAGTMVHLNPDSTVRFCFLSENTYMDSILCRGQGHGWMTTFHPNGHLKTIWLGEDTVIQGVPVRRATFWRAVLQKAATRFHANGQLAQGWLAESTTIQGHHYNRGEAVLFDPEGRIDLDAKPAN